MTIERWESLIVLAIFILVFGLITALVHILEDSHPESIFDDIDNND